MLLGLVLEDEVAVVVRVSVWAGCGGEMVSRFDRYKDEPERTEVSEELSW